MNHTLNIPSLAGMALLVIFLWECAIHALGAIGYTLIKFRRYNKASLGELVPLEILGKPQQDLARGIGFLYQLVIPLGLSKGSTKY